MALYSLSGLCTVFWGPLGGQPPPGELSFDYLLENLVVILHDDPRKSLTMVRLQLAQLSRSVESMMTVSWAACRGPGGGRPHRLGPPLPPPWGPGGEARKDYTKPGRLHKAPTDFTKPQQTIQSPQKTIQRVKILDKTINY